MEEPWRTTRPVLLSLGNSIQLGAVRCKVQILLWSNVGCKVKERITGNLQSSDLRVALKATYAMYSTKLANHRSSQVNESFNQIISPKHQKLVHQNLCHIELQLLSEKRMLVLAKFLMYVCQLIFGPILNVKQDELRSKSKNQQIAKDVEL